MCHAIGGLYTCQKIRNQLSVVTLQKLVKKKWGVYQDQNQKLVVWPSCLAAASTPLVVIITAGVQVGRRRAAGGGGELGASALVLAELPEFVLLESRCPHMHLSQEEQRAAE